MSKLSAQKQTAEPKAAPLQPADWMRGRLAGKVVVVAGASRGCGRGIALALGDAGATVYVAGRTTRGGPPPYDSAPGTIEDTAEEVTRRGGRGIAVRADCAEAADVAALFARVDSDQARLDIAVNAVWGSNASTKDEWRGKGAAFWQRPEAAWGEVLLAGPYSHLLTHVHAAQRMAAARGGLILSVTEPAFAYQWKTTPSSLFWMLYGYAHRGINELVEAMKKDLAERKVTVAGLAPGFMRTERVEAHMAQAPEAEKKRFRYDLSESTEYSGRAVVALAADAKALRYAGKILVTGDLAAEYGFTDLDGTQPNIYRKLGMGSNQASAAAG